MKKKLLAIAVAGAFAAPTVAMAEWSLSGSVSSGITVTGSDVTLGSGSAGALSMSGSADLGNGVTGSAGFSVTGGGSGASVGLAGDFGSVTLSDAGVAWSGWAGLRSRCNDSHDRSALPRNAVRRQPIHRPSPCAVQGDPPVPAARLGTPAN